jgi:hypothetical protein
MFTAKADSRVSGLLLACAVAFSSAMLCTAPAAASIDCHVVWKGKTLIKPGLCAPISVGSTDINPLAAHNEHSSKGHHTSKS